MKRFFPILVVLMLCAACQQNKPDPVVTAKEQAKRDSLALKVAVMPTLDCLPLFYAQKCGIYDSLKLDVRLIKYMAQMDCDTAIINQRVDVAYSDLIRAALMQSRGTGLYAIMPADGNHELVTIKSKRMRTPAHLKERMIAIARHSVTDLLLDTVIQQNKLDAGSIYHPQINDINLRCNMLLNGTIDAAFLPEPYATQARIAGHKSIYNSQTQHIQLMAFIATSKAVGDQRKKKQIELLVKGYNLAVKAINEKNRPDSINHILNSYPLAASTVDTLKLPSFRPAHPFNNEQVTTAIRFLKKRALITNKYKGDTLISTLFIK